MKGKYIKKIRRKLEIPALTLIMLAVSTGVLAPAEVSAAVSNLPGTVEVTYEEDDEVVADTTKISDKEAASFVPVAYRKNMLASDLSLSYVKKYDGSNAATMTNYPAMRLAIENLLGVDKIYALGKYSSSGKLTKEAFDNCRLGQCLGGQNYIYGDTNLVNYVLADTSTASKNRKQLASITADYLNLEKGLSSSPFVGLYTYYGVLDSKVLSVPSSLNDKISKQDMISLLLNCNTFQRTNDYSTTEGQSDFELLRYASEDDSKTLAKAFTLSEKYTNTKYAQAAVTEYLAHCAYGGNFYDMEDISYKNMQSSLTRLEAMYDITALRDVNGIYTGASYIMTDSFSQSVSMLVNTGNEEWGLKHTTTVKDFDTSKLALKNVVIDKNKFREEFLGKGSNYQGKLKNIKKNTKSDESKYDCTDGATYAEKVKKKTGKYKIVKQKKTYYVQKWKKLGNGQKIDYMVKKTKIVKKKVAVTKDYTRVTFSEVNYTDSNIAKIRKDFNKAFSDGSSYKIMSASELANAKKAVNYYYVYATKGYCAAQSKLNAYAMKQKVLTPEMAARVLLGYGLGLFTTNSDKSLNLYASVTWNDAITWHASKMTEVADNYCDYTLNR